MSTHALEMLEKDHSSLRRLLSQLTETTPRAAKKRSDLLEKIGAEVRSHAKVEEEIFYPALREAAKKNEQKKILFEAYEEHRAVEKLVLPDLEKTDPTTVEFGGRAKVLRDLIEHHAEEEEEEIFGEAKALLSEDELRDLGERMKSRKQELLGG